MKKQFYEFPEGLVIVGYIEYYTIERPTESFILVTEYSIELSINDCPNQPSDEEIIRESLNHFSGEIIIADANIWS